MLTATAFAAIFMHASTRLFVCFTLDPHCTTFAGVSVFIAELHNRINIQRFQKTKLPTDFSYRLVKTQVEYLFIGSAMIEWSFYCSSSLKWIWFFGESVGI